MTIILLELRQAVRSLRRSPIVAVGAIALIALGIAATTAVFSVIDGVLLRSIAAPNADRLVAVLPIRAAVTNRGSLGATASFFGFENISSRHDVFDATAAYSSDRPAMTRSGAEPERIWAWNVSRDFAHLMGARVEIGRSFLPEDHVQGASRVVILSHSTWKKDFGGDTSVLRRSIELDGSSYQVIGVMLESFHLPALPASFGEERIGVWRPLEPELTSDVANSRGPRGGLWIVGVLKSGLSAAGAEANLNALFRGLSMSEAKWRGILARVLPLKEVMIGETRRPLWLVFAAVALVLLIACANVGSLLLARGLSRERELAIRFAIGASSARVFRQLFIEASVLALAGSAIGLLVANWCVPVLASLASADLPRTHEIRINSSVLLASLGASVGTALLCGVAPAIHAVREISAGGLTIRSRLSSMGVRALRAIEALVVFQLALTVVLLMAASVVGISLVHALHSDLGFQGENVLVAQLNLPADRYPGNGERLAFARSVVNRIESFSGPGTVAISTGVPLLPGARGTVRNPSLQGEPIEAWITAATPEFFGLLGIPIRVGMTSFGNGTSDAEDVILNETAAKALFGVTNPLGKRIILNNAAAPQVIIGVVGDTKSDRLDGSSSPQIYQSLYADAAPYMKVIVRSKDNTLAFAPVLKRVLKEVDPLLPIDRLASMNEVMSASLRRQRFYGLLLAIFAGAGLLIALVGLYASIAYSVARRSREFSLRIALGAQPREVVRLVFARTIGIITLGLAGGWFMFARVSRLLQAVVYDVHVGNSLVLAIVLALLAACGVIASVRPARIASRADPMATLRND